MHLDRKNRLAAAIVAMLIGPMGQALANTSNAEICAAATSQEKAIQSKLQTPGPCRHDSECAAVSLGCPFPCAAVVAASERAEFDRSVERLRKSQAEGDCGTCVYRCGFAEFQRQPKCVAARCTLEPAK